MREENILRSALSATRLFLLKTAKADEYGRAIHETMLFAEGLSRRRDYGCHGFGNRGKCVVMKRIVCILALRPDCHFPCGAGLHVLGCLPLALWGRGSFSPKTRFCVAKVGVFLQPIGAHDAGRCGADPY